MMQVQDNSLLYQVLVLDNQDPLMLGRIRAVRLIDNLNQILTSIKDPDWNPEKDPWTERDPLIWSPLVPYFNYTVPKENEMALGLFANNGVRFVNQYYIQSTFYSPTATGFQYYQGGNKFTATGYQIKSPLNLLRSDGTYEGNGVHKGVFPEATDNALLGRGSADVIVKQDEVLIRAGKFKGSSLQPNVLPTANQKRAFLQLSRFGNFKKDKAPRKVTSFTEKVLSVNYLIEYSIFNPENLLDKFTGRVSLYSLGRGTETNTKNLTVNSNIPEKLQTFVTYQDFDALSSADTITFINDFIKNCNESDVSVKTGLRLFPNNETKFPFFYRPDKSFYDLMTSPATGSTATTVNLTAIYSGIKLNPAIQSGFNLVYSKDKTGTPTDTKTQTFTPQETVVQSNTVAALGGDKIYLLSQNSQIPGKGKINFDDTLYGISTDVFTQQIEKKTSSLVRGEELLELLNLIVKFLVEHTHAFPGKPPVGVTYNQLSSQQVLTAMQNAVNKILNKDIKIN